MFRTVLIANRGEIAVRVAAACQARGIKAVAVYSDADRDALHVRAADEAYPIGPAPAARSYLNIEAIMAAAARAHADALHPGYGFLSENPALAEACQAEGVTFIGPSPAAMRLLGSKIAAKKLAAQAGVPTVPGYHGDDQSDATLLARARDIGTPLLIKAAAGGGGRGMREVHSLDDFAEALAAARREARASFGDETMLLERLIENPRHVEFQIVGDAHGAVLHLGERECSVQRRHQKIIEEAPSPAVSPALRAEMGAAAVRVARAAGYTNAGTAEFMLAPDGSYYFLEMNARLQVEHPVTEYVTGLDLVALQLHVAAGEPLPFGQDDVALRGYALECRVYAEDPATGFLPSTGQLLVFGPPRAPGVRVDAGVAAGDEVTVNYDSMLAKLITTGKTRGEAIARGLWALRRFHVLGVTTNVAFLARTIDHPAFRSGDLSTAFVARHLSDAMQRAAPSDEALLLAAAWLATASLAPPAPGYDPWLVTSNWSLAATRALRFTAGDAEYAVEMARGATGWRVSIGDRTYDVQDAERDGAAGLTLRLATDQRDDEAEDAPTGSAGFQPAPGVGTTGDRLEAGTPREALSSYALQDTPGGRVLHGHVAQRDGALLVAHAGATWTLRRAVPPDADAAQQRQSQLGGGDSLLEAPMPGTVLRVYVQEGDRVAARQRVAVLEAMKMEHVVEAPYDGVVRAVLHREGDLVAAGERLVEIEET